MRFRVLWRFLSAHILHPRARSLNVGTCVQGVRHTNLKFQPGKENEPIGDIPEVVGPPLYLWGVVQSREQVQLHSSKTIAWNTQHGWQKACMLRKDTRTGRSAPPPARSPMGVL